MHLYQILLGLNIVLGWGFLYVRASGSAFAAAADRHVGSVEWAYTSSHRPGRNTWKCNTFVAEIIEGAGGSVPHRRWWRWSPIGANEWANPSSSYLTSDNCWSRTYSPTRGDVAAYGGHVGIVTGTRTTTSAATDSVVKNDWGFRSGQSTVFWRYTC